MPIHPDTSTLLDALQQFVWTSDVDGKYRSVNVSFAKYTGLTETALLNRGWQQAIHPQDRDRVVAHWKSAVAQRTNFNIQYRMRRYDGCYRWFQASASEIHGSNNKPELIVGTCIDIEDNERQAQFLHFIADIGASLSSTFDLERTLLRAARLSVPRVADLCVLFMRESDGILRVIGTEHEQEDFAELASRLFRSVRLSKDGLLANIAQDSEPLCSACLTTASFANDLGLSHAESELERLEPRSALYIPLSRNRTVVAVLLLVCGPSGRQYAASDVHFAKVIAKRAAKILESADRYERDHRVATKLQQTSLPVTLPTVEGFDLDAMYVAARDEAQIGGDWYDAFCLPDGRLVVTIGDVSGNGLEAAVVMGSARQILRGAAHLSPDPATMLDAADRALREERPQSFVTAFVAIFDTVAGTITYATAGHPWPLVLQANGSISELQAVGLPLGLRIRSTEPSTVRPLEAGASFVFYTDGLVESTRDILSGTDRVRKALESEYDTSREKLAHVLYTQVIGRLQTFDDLAILTVSLNPGMVIGQLTWSFTASDAEKAIAARNDLRRQLIAAGAHPQDCNNAELVFVELLANVIRHTPGRMEATLTLNGHLPVLHVCDYGPGFRFTPKLPGNPLAEEGRGLYLIASLTEDFTVSPRSEGGSHARAVLQVMLPAHRHQQPRQEK